MNRRSICAAIALLVVGVVAADAKPRKFSWELSPYFAARTYDDAFDDINESAVYGVRLGYNVTRHWEIESAFSFMAANRDRRATPPGPRHDIDVDTLDLNVTLNLNTDQNTHETHGRWMSGDRWIPYVTAGFGHLGASANDGAGRDAWTVNFGGGARLMVNEIVGVRFDLRDYQSISESGFDSSFNNFEGSIGMSFIVGGGVPRDSDSDGVIDGDDKCPGTPLGCWVDEFGCPRDSDGDGVCDGLDRCPNTPAGCPVDQNGCPLDADGDGVCDGLDDCPDTPAGCWVNDRGCPKDSDADGVCDGVDKCPDTPAGCKVDAQGCPLDGDGDGVCDGKDQCPDSPRGAKVDAVGCTVETVRLVLANVNFEFNKAEVRPFYRSILDEVAKSLLTNEYRTLELELRGHTDNVDSVEYNYRLGQERANAVKEYLVGRGVAPARITTKSYSELQPVASNDTAEGRAQNRRVEIVPTPAGAVPAEKLTDFRILVREILFTGSSTELNADGMKYLDEVAGAFARDPMTRFNLRVLGHATGANASTVARGRADAVSRYLQAKGIPAARIVVEDTGVSGNKVEVLPISQP